MTPKRYQLPAGFVWGAATAAFQIEGALEAGGRGQSIWDEFCRRPGAIRGGANAEDACRHYELYERDLDLMKALGLQSYRFSFGWPRVQPGGRGGFNEAGFAFYDRLIDGMLARGIRPNATAYHWDLPLELERAGGWLNRDTAYRFRDYADELGRRFGDRVDFWATFNEANIFTMLGYENGHHAPGRREGAKAYRQVIHHVLLAHGLGAQALRPRLRRPGAQLGIVMSPMSVWAQDARPGSLRAAANRFAMDSDWWLQPMVLGGYPDFAWRRLGADVPEVAGGDLALMRQPLDYLGLNYYSPARVVEDPLDPDGWKVVPRGPLAPTTSMPHWEVFAPALRSLLLRTYRRYKLPLYVTENGLSLAEDAPGPDGAVHDPRRIDFLKRHLVEIARAVEAGADVRGYFHWSFMDNFEWALGYTQRFGLVHVDYASFARTPKDSALWYRDAIAANGFDAEDYPDLRNPLVQPAMENA